MPWFPFHLIIRSVRAQNIERHRELAEQLKQSFEEKYPDMKKAERKKRARKPKDTTSGPTRRSTRLAAPEGSMDVDSPTRGCDI
ncbi:hypothetical protein DFH06DRAFT_1325207 [Mycena polygramma]|nr:hypothetical protein DFH06DRAFT_1325207 [Mycena polygramma]